MEKKTILETAARNRFARLGMSCRIEFGPEIQSTDQIFMGSCVRKKMEGVFTVPQQAIYLPLRNDPAFAAFLSVLYV
tara:strand:- start:12 stop:242 length:231 start_codon:yes stop_codon:yes gene_type:complete